MLPLPGSISDDICVDAVSATVSLLPLELDVYRERINVEPAGSPRTEKYGSSMDVKLYSNCSPLVSYISKW